MVLGYDTFFRQEIGEKVITCELYMVTKQKSVIAFHGMVLYNNGRRQGKIWINCNKQ